jgi:hypothetical protein
MLQGFEDFVGIKVSAVIAGTLGGIVAAIIDKGPFWQRATSVVGGLICTIYLTPIFVEFTLEYLERMPSTRMENAVAFLTGATGMVLARGITDWIREKAKGGIIDIFIKRK